MHDSYPESKRDAQIDDFHGTVVADPYRWLEQSAETPEVRDWIARQNEVTRCYFEGDPLAAQIRRRLAELWNHPRESAPVRKGKRYFQLRNSGLQKQDVLFVMPEAGAAGRILLDPNTLSRDGRVALTGTSASPDGELLAYGLSEAGSDWTTWHVRNVATGEDLADRLEWVKFTSLAWLRDGSGFYYQRFEEPQGDRYLERNEAPKLCLHRIGTEQSEDVVVFERQDEPSWMFFAATSDDDRYLVLHISRSTEPRNLLYYRPLEGGEFQPLVDEFEDQVLFIGNDGDTFYLRTDRGNGMGKVVAVDLASPTVWRDLVPEGDYLLEGAGLVANEFVLTYQEHGSHRLRRCSTGGEPQGEIELPGLGSVAALTGERDHDEGFILFTSFLEPPTAYRLSYPSGKMERLSDPDLPFDASRYLVRQEFAESPDGTRVPLFLVHHRDLERNGDNPALLYGYGGFNVSLTPAFSVNRLAWLERGGVLAIANLRGGGEYGREWHEAGTLERKQNVFDDFIACAEHLIWSGITSTKRLAIQGGSNGGLLVGACITQRPELFGAAHAAVGVFDMLRYHLFTVGSRWASDFGRADDPEQFPFLHAYSPLHNVQPGTCYPATLLTTGDHDDRVVPAHTFKFAATLQAAQGCDHPILVRIETRAGHGMGKPTDAIIDEYAEVWAFLLKELGEGAESTATHPREAAG
ncbi:MAG TPA: prolyl oligopeptidase family serine peptidase [Trueperaceae bacterium]